MEMKEIADMLVERKKAFDEFTVANDKLLAAKAEGKAVGDLTARVETLSAALDKFGDIKQEFEDLQKKMNRPANDGGAEGNLEKEVKNFNGMRRAAAGQGAKVADVDAEAYTAYKGAFWEFQRKGNIDWLSEMDRKAMSVGTDSDGGYLVPAPTVGRIVQKVYDLSPIRQIANVMAISTDALEGVNDLDEAAFGWVGEVATRSDTNTPTVGKYRIEAHEMYAQPKATQKLLDDSAVDIETWLAMKVADKFARAEGAAFITGTGVGQPRGFASYTTAATGDATRAWGQLEHVNTGASGAFHTTQADPLFDLIGAFKTPYLQQARFVTRREVITAIRKFKTTTTLEYIWQPGLQAGQPDRLLGYPIVMAQDMPALASGSLSLAFGDFAEAYQIVDRIGMRTLRDPFTDKPYIKFYTTKRTGGGVVNYEALKFLRFGT